MEDKVACEVTSMNCEEYIQRLLDLLEVEKKDNLPFSMHVKINDGAERLLDILQLFAPSCQLQFCDSDFYSENLLSFLEIKENLSSMEVRAIICHAAKLLFEELTAETAEFLRNNLKDHWHTEDDVRAVIRAMPDALSSEDAYGALPIHYVVKRTCSASFLPTFVQEGIKLNVGGSKNRGGLLLRNDTFDGANLLQCLCRNLGRNKKGENVCLKVVRRLREMDLLKKEDIVEHNLLEHCIMENSFQLLRFFIQWHPEAMKICRWKSPFYEGMPLLHVGASWDSHVFASLLQCTLHFFPNELGLLFQVDDDGKTAIFHAAYVDTTEFIKLFVTDEGALVKMNRKTHMYPFMLAAAGETYALSFVYLLLLEDPTVISAEAI